MNVKQQYQEWGNVILRAAVILLLLFYFCWPIRLSGSSMEPTVADGSVVFLRRFVLGGQGYRDGDVVVFRYAGEDGTQTLIKRIIATEGEHIRILPEGVERNDVLLQETYAQGRTDGLVDMTVPEGTVFVLGDNRQESYDSRNIGVIPMEDLRGKVFFCIYPWGYLGKL